MERDRMLRLGAAEGGGLAEINEITGKIVEGAFQVHRGLGPGLLESVYERCLCRELDAAGLPYRRQVDVPVRYKSELLDAGLRLDLIVAESVIVELKSVESLLPIHTAQLLTYLKLTRTRIGLLINFNVPLIRQGIRRVIL